jgi:hypothetical protein
MSKLLKAETFDDFDLHSLTIHNFACFEINKIPTEPPPGWRAIRPHAFDIIKAANKPSYIKLVLAIPAHMLEIENSTPFLNIVFEGDKILITSGISQKTFTLDRSAHTKLNSFILQFLTQNNIGYTNELKE